MKTIKVVLSPKYGGSLVDYVGYDVVENPEFVAAVEAGSPPEVLLSLVGRLAPEDHWLEERDLTDLVVREVTGPYLIQDYDGAERIIQPDQFKWRNV